MKIPSPLMQLCGALQPKHRVIPLCVFALGIAAAQSNPSDVSKSHEHRKEEVVQVLHAMGMSPSAARLTTSIATGTLTIVGEAPVSGAIKYETSGTDKIRSEFSAPTGQIIRITNAGTSTIQLPDSKPKRLSPNNSLFDRVRHIPALSVLAEVADGNADLLDDGGQFHYTAAPSAAKSRPKDVETIQSMLKREFEVDPQTGLVSKLRFTSYSEDDDVTRTEVEIVYSDYRRVNGIAVPFHQQTYLDGRLRTELQLSDVQFNVAIPDSEFLLPEVK